MAKVTLSTLLAELQKNNARLDRIEAKNDDRFELIKQEFQAVRSDLQLQTNSIRSEMNQVRSEINRFRSEVTVRFDVVDVRLNKMQSSIDLVAEQTSKHVDALKSLTARVSKLENASA